jgi:hypothetical protein
MALTRSRSRSASPPSSLATERQQLLHQADAALYWGKRHGRTDVQLFDPARHGMAEDWRTLEELAAAVVRVASGRLLTPVYQPIYSLTTGEVLGYEGLVRPRPDAGFANPGAMFVAAESTGRPWSWTSPARDRDGRGARAGPAAVPVGEPLAAHAGDRGVQRTSCSRWPGASASTPRGSSWSDRARGVEDGACGRRPASPPRRRTAADVGSGNAGLRLPSEVEFDVMKIDLSLVRGSVQRDVRRGPAGAGRSRPAAPPDDCR